MKKSNYNKYHNKKVIYGNKKFDSKKELGRYKYLKLLERAKEIQQLERQKKFILQPSFKDKEGKTQRAITYIADFHYYDNKKHSYIAEDVKGYKTDVYKIKSKMFMYQYKDIIFREII